MTFLYKYLILPFSVPDEQQLYVVDFYEQELSNEDNSEYPEEEITATCCKKSDTKNVTCGGKTSCAAQCTALVDYYLCPTGQCTEDPDDCKPHYEEDNESGSSRGLEDWGRQKGMRKKKFSGANLPSWRLNWCSRGCGWKVWKKPICCFHPTCWRLNLKRCRWAQNYSGKPNVVYLI